MVRVAEGCWRWAVPATAAGLALALLWLPAGLAGPVLGASVVWFHRDPERDVPDDGLLAPADGTVSVLREEDVDGEERLRLGIFMNLHDVHVNRAPQDSRVESVEHTTGAHWPAFSKASERNERCRLVFEDHEVVLIAGALARRITPYVDAGQRVERGERIGHISFSSRVDVVFPPDVSRDDLLVGQGDSVRAGETRLVDSSPPERR